MVTASPYHPLGKVRNVPGWRLSLSRGASFLYRRVLRQDIHTFTSCFRVYRRGAVTGLNCSEGGFLGIAEMLGLLVLRGGRIVEHPAALEVRLFGQSKMKFLRTVVGHLGLLSRLLAARLRQRDRADGAAREPAFTESLISEAGPCACADDGGELFSAAATPAAPPLPVKHVTPRDERTTLVT